MLRHVFLLLCIAAHVSLTPHLYAQQQESALSDAEVEKLRDSAADPPERLQVFIGFLDNRAKEIRDRSSGPRRPGREQDIHDLIEQFTSIADELDDNLDDYGPRHADLRKALPKLVDATERWATAIKSPPEDEAYSVSRKIALESVRDLHDAATQMVAEQETWFKAHPAAKQKQQQQNEPIDIPR